MQRITMAEWLHSYEGIVQKRLISGVIKLKTFSDYRRLIAFCMGRWGQMPLEAITVAEITGIIHALAQDTPFTARRLRINMSDLFLEAQRAGVLTPGHNPALVSKYPLTYVKAERLELGEWMKIFRAARYVAPDYFQLSILFALITAQRPSDLVRMNRTDIKDGHLHIEQFKTGEKIALPLDLRLEVIDTSLRDIISLCPDTGFLLQKQGKPVNTWSLSRWFRICRQQSGLVATKGTLPPFREQRSLAERLYRAQGIDTQTLLGHKYQRMTDAYNDIRGKGFRTLKL